MAPATPTLPSNILEPQEPLEPQATPAPLPAPAPAPSFKLLSNSNLVVEVVGRRKRSRRAELEEPPSPLLQIDGEVTEQSEEDDEEKEEVEKDNDLCVICHLYSYHCGHLCDICNLCHPGTMPDPETSEYQTICPTCILIPPCEVRGRYTDPHKDPIKCAEGCINRFHLHRKKAT